MNSMIHLLLILQNLATVGDVMKYLKDKGVEE